jgi:hypothetical protein
MKYAGWGFVTRHLNKRGPFCPVRLGYAKLPMFMASGDTITQGWVFCI